MEPAKAAIIEKYHFMPTEEAMSPKGWIVYNITNSWWIVHPEYGLAFWDKGYSHPQCNRNKLLIQKMCPEWGEVKFLERVFAPCNINDYRD